MANSEFDAVAPFPVGDSARGSGFGQRPGEVLAPSSPGPAAVTAHQKNMVAMPKAMSRTAPIMTSCSSLTSSGGERDIGSGALNGPTLDRYPQKTTPLTAPVLDASRNGGMLQLNFADSDRLTAAGTIRHRLIVGRRVTRLIEPMHSSTPNGGDCRCIHDSANPDLSACRQSGRGIR